MEKTLAIIKPDAVSRGLTGDILKRIEASGLSIRAIRKLHLSQGQAQMFYAVHKARPFYGDLCKYMTSGPVVVAVLGADGAIAKWRELMGATDPAKAAAGTIRREFGQNIEANATHGSDAPETAAQEIAFFFPAMEILS
ncbi:MAG: nucleoside-diphosphate kinase [Candidatus Binataceae bacterium]|jgi:nucleoside-diphosphate kinase